MIEPSFENFAAVQDGRLDSLLNPTLLSIDDRSINTSLRKLELRQGVYQPVWTHAPARFLGLLVQGGSKCMELGFRYVDYRLFAGPLFPIALAAWQSFLPSDKWIARSEDGSRYALRFSDKIISLVAIGSSFRAGEPAFYEGDWLKLIAHSTSSSLFEAGPHLVCEVLTGGIALCSYTFLLNEGERARYRQNPPVFLSEIDEKYAGGGPEVHALLNQRNISLQKSDNMSPPGDQGE